MTNDFSLPGYQPESYGDDAERYPLIYWLSSTKVGGVVGAWHTASFATMPAPWEQSDRFDNEEVAFESRTLTFVPLRQRMQWYVSTPDGDTKAIPHYMESAVANEWVRKQGFQTHVTSVRSTTQVMAMVEGIDEPVIIQAKGMVAKGLFQRPTKRSPGGDVYRMVNAMLGVANQTKKGSDPIPHFAFTVTLETPLGAKGRPQTTEVGGGAVVVHPRLVGDPNAVSREDLVKRFIGRERLQLALAMYLECEVWSKAPARNDFFASTTPPPPPAPSNAPQALEDDDDDTPLPF